MSRNPYEILGLEENAEDALIRARYLELVKQFPPGQDSERFNEIRWAYDQLRDRVTRVTYRLFDSSDEECIERMIEELACQAPSSRQRIPLQKLLALVQPVNREKGPS